MSVREYVVEMLIRHEMTVTTTDDVQARIEAWKALGPTMRARVDLYRVCDGRGQPLEGPWESPDREWLEGNINE